MIEKTGDRTFCTKCGQKVAECRCEKMSNMVECPACDKGKVYEKDRTVPNPAIVEHNCKVCGGKGKIKKDNNDSGEKKAHHSPNCPSLEGKPVCTCGHLRRYGNDDDSGEKIPKELEGRFTVHNILCIEANLMDCEEAERIEKLIRKCIAEEPKPSIAEEYCTFKNGVCIFKRNITEKIHYYPRSKITEATLAGWIEEWHDKKEYSQVFYSKALVFGLARFLKEKGV